jgi:hypothetical protein
MSTQYRLVQSGKTASGGCSAGQGSSEPVAPRIKLKIFQGKKHGIKIMYIVIFDYKIVLEDTTLLKILYYLKL